MPTRLVATAWTSAGDTSPMRTPATSPVPIAERVAAIADAGFCGFGLIADDLVAIRDAIGFAALRDLIADAGLTHVEIELLERWWIPRGAAGHTYDVRDLLFEAADVLRPAMIKIGSENGPRDDGSDSPLRHPCGSSPSRRRTHGTKVAIETMPFSAIATVPMGAEIVSAAGHPAAGLLVDAWHVFRAGTSLAELRAALRPEMIFGVELDDAARRGRRHAVRGHRRPPLLCGDGSFDLVGLVATLRDLGFDGPWGVEILSSSFRALPVDQALRLAADSALTVL